MPNLSLIGGEIKKLWKTSFFDGKSGLKLEMTSLSGNAYDVTNFFFGFEKFLAFTLFLSSFIVVRHQMAELNWGTGGGGLFAPIQYRGIPDPVQNTVSHELRSSLRKDHGTNQGS